jgi:hypothetical protein
MPQPLSNVRSKIKLYPSADSLMRRPELASLVGQIISRWAFVETNAHALAIQTLRAEFKPIMAMMGALRNSNAQIDLLSAIGESTLEGNYLEYFLAFISMLRKQARTRNEIAHNIWCHHDELPDALILIPQASYHKCYVTVLADAYAPSSKKNPEGEDGAVADLDTAMVYKISDLKKIIADIETIARCNTFLIHSLFSPFHESRERMQKQLLSEPLFQTALSQVKKNRTATQ